MLRWTVCTTIFLMGCAEGPKLPGFTEIPIEAPAAEYEPCASARGADIRCVLDGDTASVGRCESAGERIRLLGIDAPEIAHEGQPADCYGDKAWDELAQMIENELVWLTFGAECQDIYERTLAWVWLITEDDDPILVSEWMLRHGHARIYDGEGTESLIYRERLESAQQSAMKGKLGLWGECDE